MNGEVGRGLHIFLDYINYTSPVENDGEWMLNKLRDNIKKSGIREVHSHVEKFDGTKSPPGFAAVVLIDESHVTLPQIRAMFGGDRSRKENLVEYGFRLPAAMDNRPLKFEEFESFARPGGLYMCT